MLEKLSIVFQVIVKFDSYRNIAKEFGVSQSYVSLLVRKAARNPRFLRELYEKEMANAALVEKVKREVIKYHYEGIIFTSTEQI